MININILTYLDYNLFDQQFDKTRFSGEYCFYENSSLDIEWDMVVIFEDIKEIKTIRCKKGGLVFISAEPPMSSVYSYRFLNQFDIICSKHSRIKYLKKTWLSLQYVYDWHLGKDPIAKSYKYSFEEIKYMDMPSKTNNISVITSSHAMLPFHHKRLDFLEKIKHVFEDKIDFYGRGFNPIDYKADGILPYRFHICIENASITDYWTEKFADPLLGYSIPIYIGCTNMKKYFPEDSFYTLNINDVSGAITLLNKILADPEKLYNEKIKYLINSRELLIEKYNIYPTLIELYSTNIFNLNSFITTKIKPNFSFFEYAFLNYNLRLKRLLYKIYYNIKKRI